MALVDYNTRTAQQENWSARFARYAGSKYDTTPAAQAVGGAPPWAFNGSALVPPVCVGIYGREITGRLYWHPRFEKREEHRRPAQGATLRAIPAPQFGSVEEPVWFTDNISSTSLTHPRSARPLLVDGVLKYEEIAGGVHTTEFYITKMYSGLCVAELAGDTCFWDTRPNTWECERWPRPCGSE